MNCTPRRTWRTALGTAAVGLTFLTVAACGASGTTAPPAAAPTSSAPSTAPSSETAPSTTPSTSPSAAPSTSDAPSTAPSTTASTTATTKTLLAAGATARKAVDGGRVSSVELEDDGTWEVHVVTSNGGEQQVRVSADGSDITSGPRDDRPDREDVTENRAFHSADVDYREAAEIAGETVSGSQVRELSMDREAGRTVWDVEVRDGSRQVTVTINAANGNVLGQENDD